MQVPVSQKRPLQQAGWPCRPQEPYLGSQASASFTRSNTLSSARETGNLNGVLAEGRRTFLTSWPGAARAPLTKAMAKRRTLVICIVKCVTGVSAMAVLACSLMSPDCRGEKKMRCEMGPFYIDGPLLIPFPRLTSSPSIFPFQSPPSSFASGPFLPDVLPSSHQRQHSILQ